MLTTDLADSKRSDPTATEQPRRRVLLAEDDEAVRAMITQVLGGLSFEIEAAHNGDSAIKALRCATFDALVTDIHMPEMDGLELIRAARTIHPSLHIVAISGGDSYGMSFLRAAHQMGASVVLPKPFEIARLIAALRTAVPLPSS